MTPGTDRVHPDSVGCALERQSPRERHHSGLRRPVSGTPGRRDEVPDRRVHDDRAAPPLLHAGHHPAGHQERRRQVRPKDPVPLLEARVLDELLQFDARVVHEDIHRAEPALRGPHDRLDAFFRRNVGDHTGRRPTRIANRGGHPLERLPGDVSEHDLGALFGKEFRGSPADPGGSAGYHGDPVVQSLVLRHVFRCSLSWNRPESRIPAPRGAEWGFPLLRIARRGRESVVQSEILDRRPRAGPFDRGSGGRPAIALHGAGFRH